VQDEGERKAGKGRKAGFLCVWESVSKVKLDSQYRMTEHKFAHVVAR
jgi:hypothetical protein